MRDNRMGILLTGVGIGAAAGLLFARYSNDEMRGKLLRKAGAAKEYLKDQAGTIADCVGDAAGQMDQTLAKGKGLVRDLNQQAKGMMADVTDTATATAANVIDKSRAAISKAGTVVQQQRQRLENA